MKYKVDESLKGCEVWTKDGKVAIDDATDKQLETLLKMGVKGISKVDDEPKKPSKKESE